MPYAYKPIDKGTMSYNREMRKYIAALFEPVALDKAGRNACGHVAIRTKKENLVNSVSGA